MSTSPRSRNAVTCRPARMIENAVAEGVQLHPGWGPVSISDDGQFTLRSCEQTRDEKGNFNPKFDASRLLTLEANHVILATGQGTDLTILDGSGVESSHGFIVADPENPDDQRAGRLRWRRCGARPADGRGSDPLREDRRGLHRCLAARRAPGRRRRAAGAARHGDSASCRRARSHASAPRRDARTIRRGSARRGRCIQIEEGLSDAAAHDEARRCLRCDVCIGCGLCMAACSEMGVEALRMGDTTAGRLAYFDFMRPSSLCIGCGATPRSVRPAQSTSKIGMACGAQSSREPS